jgi:Tfp pilus assembly protein PilN
LSQVNLLPPELLERQALKRRTRLVIAAGSVVLALIAAFYVMQMLRLSSANDELAAQQSRNAQLETQIAQLNQFAELQAELAAKEELLTTVLANEFSWSSALLDVSHVIPDDAALSSFVGDITVPTGAPAGVPTDVVGVNPDVVGTITFQGTALDIRTVALWLNQLEKVKGWVQATPNSIIQQGTSNIYTFDTVVQITNDALEPPEEPGADATTPADGTTASPAPTPEASP